MHAHIATHMHSPTHPLQASPEQLRSVWKVEAGALGGGGKSSRIVDSGMGSGVVAMAYQCSQHWPHHPTTSLNFLSLKFKSLSVLNHCDKYRLVDINLNRSDVCFGQV